MMMRMTLVLFGLLSAVHVAWAEEVTCKYDSHRISTPADSRIAGNNRFHMGVKIRCLDGPVLNIANEKLAKKFDDEFNGRVLHMKARMSGVLHTTVKKHGADLLEITKYTWTEASPDDPAFGKKK